jgi:hypothetical protein
MQIPSILHGSYETARRHCAVAIRAFLGSRPWNDAISSAFTVDTEQVEGLVVLNGPAPLLAGEAHFQIFLPLAMLLEGVRKGRVAPGKRDEAVAASLSTSWGILGVLAPKNQLVVYPPALHRPILIATVASWPELDGIGPRYTVGLREGKRLWDVTTNLQYVLGQVGIDAARLRAPLAPGGLHAVIPAGLLNEK